MKSNIDVNHHFHNWLSKRGITDEVMSIFNLSVYNHPVIGECIKIPYTADHAKYRRDPMDERKPKYLYDAGGKVTLFGFDKLSDTTVVITEGELDALVLWSMNIPAVSSTGGALSFQEQWAMDLRNAEEIYLCFDNDAAGAEGMVKVLKYLPRAKVIFIPQTSGVKDISDYVSRGGDFRALMASARSYKDITEVEAERVVRGSQWLPVEFHDRYIAEHRQQAERATKRTVDRKDISDEVLKAKAYPLDNLMEFQGKQACCPFHNEKTPSLHYYAKTNSAYCFGACGKSYDSINVYQQLHSVGFIDAVKALNNLI